MPRTTRTIPVACGCVITEWYAWSEDGLHDDGDQHVDECAWHGLQSAAFDLWLRAIDAGTTEAAYDEIHWLQVAEREAEYSEYAEQWAWQQVRPASDAYAAF